MPQSKEEQKAYKKKWYEEHKEERKVVHKKWYEEHKEEKKASGKKYREEHKEEQKAYNQSDAGKKAKRICKWKRRGVLSDDYDALYDKFLNTEKCEECDCELIDGGTFKNSRCLDHDHSTGLFRNVLCVSCNCKRK
jgi:hypothetical protein